MFEKSRLTLCRCDKHVQYTTQERYRFNRSFHHSIWRQRVHIAVQVLDSLFPGQIKSVLLITADSIPLNRKCATGHNISVQSTLLLQYLNTVFNITLLSIPSSKLMHLLCPQNR